ncbi:hypothetical protein P7K49_005843 [Saguinus oedipus]|uniref:Uncharacterized protein n=1 Tax=Saguinus oedipus TaxID=9490 RepID=A0ABQ9W0P9_SAGOE|nr:hypothetical protein P7K49_005843 [Saguinus oedipus]
MARGPPAPAPASPLGPRPPKTTASSPSKTNRKPVHTSVDQEKSCQSPGKRLAPACQEIAWELHSTINMHWDCLAQPPLRVQTQDSRGPQAAPSGLRLRGPGSVARRLPPAGHTEHCRWPRGPISSEMATVLSEKTGQRKRLHPCPGQSYLVLCGLSCSWDAGQGHCPSSGAHKA